MVRLHSGKHSKWRERESRQYTGKSLESTGMLRKSLIKTDRFGTYIFYCECILLNYEKF